MIEYSVELSEHVITLRRTKTWLLGSLVGALFPLTGAVIMGRLIYVQPLDRFSQVIYIVFLCGMASVLYRLLFWGRSVVFDKVNDLILIDGRKLCVLSDLTSVQMEGSQRSALAPRMGRLRGLHLRTAQGKDVTIKWAWESTAEYSRLVDIVQAIAQLLVTKDDVA